MKKVFAILTILSGIFMYSCQWNEPAEKGGYQPGDNPDMETELREEHKQRVDTAAQNSNNK